ncbi:MAG: adenylyl-sulfate kinase [Cyclobacteriaceae bacterium]|nr:adenylyl-sulfate kinase [Cyclobacteriaceae bacterium]
MENIHPIFNKILTSDQKALLLNQRALVVWMVGMSGSGKSTLARALENELYSRGFYTMLIDGDNLRTGLNNNLGFSEEDRVENIRRAAETARLFANNGVVTICSLISPTTAIRKMAREIIGQNYFEVFIHCPLDVCEQRDVKGLYAKARRGEIKNFTGIDSPFEPPLHPQLEIRTDRVSEEKALKILIEAIVPEIIYKK